MAPWLHVGLDALATSSSRRRGIDHGTAYDGSRHRPSAFDSDEWAVMARDVQDKLPGDPINVLATSTTKATADAVKRHNEQDDYFAIARPEPERGGPFVGSSMGSPTDAALVLRISDASKPLQKRSARCGKSFL